MVPKYIFSCTVHRPCNKISYQQAQLLQEKILNPFSLQIPPYITSFNRKLIRYVPEFETLTEFALIQNIARADAFWSWQRPVASKANLIMNSGIVTEQPC